MVSGPKYYSINGIWALKPYYLGPWTLRVRYCFLSTYSRTLAFGEALGLHFPKLGASGVRSWG